MNQRPRIADVQCSKIHFDPGDKILIRTTHRLDHLEKEKLKKSISKWAGCELDIFIYCVLDMDMTIEKGIIGGG